MVSSKELIVQIFPLGILVVYQVNLLLPRTAFDLLLSRDGFGHGDELFVVHKFGHIIAACKTRDNFLFMFVNSLEKIARDACVENFVVLVGHNVHAGMKFSFHFSTKFPSLRGSLKG